MDDDSDEMLGVGWRDILTNLVGMMVGVVVLLAALMSVEKSKEDDASEPPGNLVASIVWPEGPTDIDMWIYGPGEKRPIGYSNKSGANWSLLRDDLGTAMDSMPANFETSYSRAIEPGHYVFNVVCYTCKRVPVKVVFELRIVSGGNQHALITTTVTLTQDRQEITIVQFDLAKDGTIVRGSMSSVFKPLFQAWH